MYKVLIAEDEDIIRKGLIFTTDWTKYNCIVADEAVNGSDALLKIRKLRPDIVITDVKMPYKDGIQMLEESIREYRYEAIIISGYGEFEYARSAMHLGVTDYLLKPVDMDTLGDTLKKTVDKIGKKEQVKQYMEKQNSEPLHNIFDSMALSRHKSKYVQYMMDSIKQHYNEKISISDLSEKMELSCTYLNSKFKEETNYTFNDFLNRYRILRAVSLLRQSNSKVYEVAEAVGFQDYKYFILVFKKYVGYSPTKFINSCK